MAFWVKSSNKREGSSGMKACHAASLAPPLWRNSLCAFNETLNTFTWNLLAVCSYLPSYTLKCKSEHLQQNLCLGSANATTQSWSLMLHYFSHTTGACPSCFAGTLFLLSKGACSRALLRRWNVAACALLVAKENSSRRSLAETIPVHMLISFLYRNRRYMFQTTD